MITNTDGSVLSIRGLIRRYPGFTLGPIDLDLRAGLVTALVGPNGSGKTTTMNCVVGLDRGDAGRVELFGRPNRAARTDWKSDLGHVGEKGAFYEAWSAAANLAFVGRFRSGWNDARARALADRLGLSLEKPVKALSKGERTKLALVAALGHQPGMLLLDEPFAGLDPVVRSDALDVLWDVVERGRTTILYSTHQLSDVERLADELVFLDSGRLVLRAPKDELSDSWRVIRFHAETAIPDPAGTFSHRVEGRDHRLVSCDYQSALEALRSAGAEELETARMSFEEIAVAVMKGGGHEPKDRRDP